MTKKASATPPPNAGDVFVGTNKHRRVLGIGNGYVIYSNGGNANRECRVTTFTRRVKRQKAVKQENVTCVE